MSVIKRMVLMLCVICCVAGVANAQPLADRIPADAIAYIGWQGLDDLGGDYEQSRFKAILDQSGYQELVGPFFQRLIARISEENPRDVQEFMMGWDLIKVLRDNPCALYVANVQPPKDGPPKAELALIVKAGDKAAALKQKLDQMIPEDEKDEVPFSFYVRGGYLLIVYGDINWYTNLTGLLSGGNGPSLKTSPKFITAMKGNQPNPIGMFYIDLPKVVDVVDMIAAFQAEQAQQNGNPPDDFVQVWPKIKQATALEAIHSLSMSFGFANRDFGFNMFVNAPAPRRGLAAMFDSGQAVQPQTLKLIPATSMIAGASSFDLKAAVESILKIIGQIDANAGLEIDKALGEIQQEFGLHPINDLLASIGTQWAYYCDDNVGGNSLLGFVAINRLRNAPKFDECMGVILAVANGLLKENLDEEINIQLRKSTIRGKTVYHLSLPYVNPSLMIDGDKLYMGLFPQMVIAAVDYAKTSPADITTNPRFQQLHKQIGSKPFTSVDYVDTELAMSNFYANGVLLSQLGLGFADLFGVQSPAMLVPPLPDMRKHLVPAGSFSWTDEQGFYIQSRGPFPGVGITAANPQYSVAGMALMAGIMVPALSNAREAANATVSAVNMRQIMMACMTYAVENDDAFPSNLGILVEKKYMTPHVVINPRSNTKIPPDLKTVEEMAKWVNQNSNYLYYPGMGANSHPSTIVLMEDPHNFNTSKGLNVAFVDGSVQFMRPYEVSRAVARHNELAKRNKKMQTIPDPCASQVTHDHSAHER